MDNKKVWILGQGLWMLIFLIISLIIFIALKFLPVEVSFLQVCIGHFLWRILKADLPVELIPTLFQKQKLNNIQVEMKKLEKELENLNL